MNGKILVIYLQEKVFLNLIWNKIVNKNKKLKFLVNIIKDDFSILITNLTNDAKEISISIINDLGYSEKSLFISIQCGYKGCEPPTKGPNIAGIVSGLLIGVLFAFILIGSVIYYKRYLIFFFLIFIIKFIFRSIISI